MLTSLIKKRLDIPNEEGSWVEIRMLSGKKLDEARAAKLQLIFEMARAMGTELGDRIAQQNRDTDDDEADPLAAFDVDTVLRGGIVSWSYKERVTPENIGDLDEATRNWAAKEIVALTVETEKARLGN